MGKVPSWFKQDYEPIIDNSIELNKLKEYIGVGRPLMLAPTMDYHKTLWGLSLANSLINDGKIVKYISLYDTAEDTKAILDEYHWKFSSMELIDNFFVKVSNVKDIFEILKNEKPRVVLIDCIDKRFNFVDNYDDFRKMLEEFYMTSLKYNISIIVMSGIWPDFAVKHMKDMGLYFSNMLSLRDANMVEIKPYIIQS